MFGYVTICEPELKVKDFKAYKACYCGLCKSLKEYYGSLGQLTLTYDMTFVILLLTSLYETELKQSMHRCKVHPVKKQTMLQNEFSEYAADMNILLSYYHLKDDWQDEKKLSGLLGCAAFGKSAEAGGEISAPESCDPPGTETLEQYEKEDRQEIDLTAGCTGRLIGRAARLSGRYVGGAASEDRIFPREIYLYHGRYEDLEKDLKDGNYNPLKALHEQPDYEERCAQILNMMMAECSAAI